MLVFTVAVAAVGGGNANKIKETSRHNQSSAASFLQDALTYPFASGAFRWVAKGSYTNGPREGEPCVCKWFKSGSVYEATYYDLDIKAVEKAVHIIQQFNCAKLVNKIIRINIPCVWVFKTGSLEGTKVLQEPFIDCWQKFNSNSGWTDDGTPWPRVMQALSHYSYHVSGGQFVLCDLQGGVYTDGVVLTDPVILSRSGEYGVTDLGPTGISNFFARHKCNEFCRREWTKPADMRAYFNPQQGTSMIRPSAGQNIPTQHGRGHMTAVYEDEDDSDDYY